MQVLFTVDFGLAQELEAILLTFIVVAWLLHSCRIKASSPMAMLTGCRGEAHGKNCIRFAAVKHVMQVPTAADVNAYVGVGLMLTTRKTMFLATRWLERCRCRLLDQLGVFLLVLLQCFAASG